MSIFSRLLQDPPPSFAFEVSPHALTAAKLNGTTAFDARSLSGDVLAVGPAQDNLLNTEVFIQAVRDLAPQRADDRRRRRAALILPDFAVRLSVLEFDSFPSNGAEQLGLVKLRMRRALPFDIEQASLSYQVQQMGKSGVEVVVAAAHRDVIGQYEQAFLDSGLHVGYITTSLLASLALVDGQGVSLLAKLSGLVLTLAAVDGAKLKLVRTIPLEEAEAEEIVGQIYPTLAYCEDQLSARASRLLLCGFGHGVETLASDFSRRFETEVEVVRGPGGQKAESHNAGLLGYLKAVGK